MKCIYKFAWYELDQAIYVGEESEFYFFKNSSPYCFYNGLLKNGKYELKRCLIKEISHPDLGSIQEINTEGLDYTITLTNGESLKVEAEESPGEVYGYPIKPKNWEFEIDVNTNT